MSVLKQRVPLTTTGLFISLEWLKDLETALAEAAAGTTNTTTTTTTVVSDAATAAAIAALQAAFVAAAADATSLAERVRKLETGYHS